MARDNPSWGTGALTGELVVLGHKLAPEQVRQVSNRCAGWLRQVTKVHMSECETTLSCGN
jgi:hypothetical protein